MAMFVYRSIYLTYSNFVLVPHFCLNKMPPKNRDRVNIGGDVWVFMTTECPLLWPSANVGMWFGHGCQSSLESCWWRKISASVYANVLDSRIVQIEDKFYCPYWHLEAPFFPYTTIIIWSSCMWTIIGIACFQFSFNLPSRTMWHCCFASVMLCQRRVQRFIAVTYCSFSLLRARHGAFASIWSQLFFSQTLGFKLETCFPCQSEKLTSF